MFRPVLILGVLAVFLVCESSCRFIHPTYKPPPTRPPIYRFRRSDDEPLWLNQGDVPRAPATGDHPLLPKYIDDIKLDPNRRVARSYNAPSAARGGGSHQKSRITHTEPTHPGYNRRNARSIPDRGPVWPTLPPFNPAPSGPRSPWEPKPARFPTLARHKI